MASEMKLRIGFDSKRLASLAVFGLVAIGSGVCHADTPKETFPLLKYGQFGPAEAVHASPGVYWTIRHGTAGVHFMEPWLAGCSPRELRVNGTSGSYSTQMGWAYDRDGRVTGSHWLSRYGERSVYTASVLDYDTRGMLTAARFNCTRMAGAERFELRYDERGRLQSQQWSHPPRCFGEEEGTERIERYVYAEPRLPQLPSAIEVEATAPQARRFAISFNYMLDDKGRITRLERSFPVGWAENYSYNPQGQVERASRMWGTSLRISEQTFRYDDQNRLSEIARVGEPASEWRFTYAADGSLKGLVAPTPHYRPDLHPRSFFAFTVEP